MISRRLRVLLAPSAYYPHVGGIEELTRQLALALNARGHETSVLTNRWPTGVPRSDVLEGVAVTRLAFPLPAAKPQEAIRFVATAPRAAIDLIRDVRRWEPDVVHVIGAGPQSVYFAALRRFTRAHLVFTTQGELTFDAHGAFSQSATLRAGLRRMLRQADSVTACSAFAMRDLISFGRIRGTSCVVPNGVDPREFKATAALENSAAPYVLAVGRLVPQKGFDILLEAFASAELDGLTLMIAGEGFEQPRLEAQAAELQLSDRVRFVGSVNRPRLAELLRGARVFAFPSRGEAFGIALLEAMAAGVPAVAAATGGVPEFARNGENALLVAPEDSAGLGTALARAATDEALRSHLVLGGRLTATELSWTAIAKRYEQIYLTPTRDDAA